MIGQTIYQLVGRISEPSTVVHLAPENNVFFLKQEKIMERYFGPGDRAAFGLSDGGNEEPWWSKKWVVSLPWESKGTLPNATFPQKARPY